jgi:hypothetical protein
MSAASKVIVLRNVAEGAEIKPGRRSPYRTYKTDNIPIIGKTSPKDNRTMTKHMIVTPLAVINASKGGLLGLVRISS